MQHLRRFFIIPLITISILAAGQSRASDFMDPVKNNTGLIAASSLGALALLGGLFAVFSSGSNNKSDNNHNQYPFPAEPLSEKNQTLRDNGQLEVTISGIESPIYINELAELKCSIKNISKDTIFIFGIDNLLAPLKLKNAKDSELNLNLDPNESIEVTISINTAEPKQICQHLKIAYVKPYEITEEPNGQQLYKHLPSDIKISSTAINIVVQKLPLDIKDYILIKKPYIDECINKNMHNDPEKCAVHALNVLNITPAGAVCLFVEKAYTDMINRILPPLGTTKDSSAITNTVNNSYTILAILCSGAASAY